jgi:hypothetical protein
MKLFKLSHRYDYGHDWYVQIISTKNWALLQASVSWNDYPSFPFLQVRFGMGSLVNIMFCIYKLGFDIGICEHTWNFEYLEKLDDEDTDYLRMDEC